MYVSLILLSCLLAATKVLIQGRCSRNLIKTPMDAILFNGMVFGAGALILVPVFGFKATFSGIIAGFLVGVFNLVYQMGYIFAFSCGPVSLTTMIATTSMIVPIMVSAAAYGEPLTPNRIVGIVVTFTALYFTTEKSEKNSVHLKWILYTAVAFVGNCCTSLTQKIYTKSFAGDGTSSFVAIHFAFTALLSLAVYGLLFYKDKRCTYRISKAVVWPAATIGFVLAGFHLVYTYALSVIDATLLLPLYNGGYTLLVTLGSTILMKEKLSKRQLISIMLGITAIILMSI